MWFDSWSDLGRILAVGTSAYVTVVVVLRLTGKRTLSKLNAFDLVVTVALGSVLATILLSGDVSWSEGALALGLLAAAQLVVAWVTVRRPGMRSAVTSRPRLLLTDGAPLPEALRGERVSMDEIRQAVRASGSGDLSTVAAVVLESDGSLSVLSRDQLGDGSALDGVEGVRTAEG
ncbi:DUF421 domain-containing protein [Trujillonella humicola]|uniref:DUF421 domain-containing protein n=1 Tax=Trujillonella humicola TaxID=3383699 RepID=UPI003905E715